MVAGGTSGSLSIKKRRVDLGLCGGGGLPPPAHTNPPGLGRSLPPLIQLMVIIKPLSVADSERFVADKNLTFYFILISDLVTASSESKCACSTKFN